VKRNFVLWTLLVYPCFAQSDTLVVRGEVEHSGSLTGSHLYIELADSVMHRRIDRSIVNSDGTFDFRMVPAGHYELRLTAEDGDVLNRMDVDVRTQGPPLSITLPEHHEATPTGETVSVARLRHTPPRKAVKLVVSAQKHAAHREFDLAAADLRKALLLDPKFPQAHGNLGVQLVRMKQTEAAVSEFRTATELDPTWAGYPANLAYALLSLDRIGEAEEQARRAIALEPANSGAHCVLGYILVRRPETRAQAIPHLRIGAREIPQAHYVLAQLLAQSGDSSSAKEEMDRFAAAGGISPEELKKWNAGLR
jgi:tetratricopeptide (TPR) repeat protein